MNVNFKWNKKNRNSLAALMPLIDGAQLVEQPTDGIMVYSFATAQADEVFREIKDASTDSIFIAGGPHPSVRPKECLEFFDYVVIGEGEETLPELIRSIREGNPIDVEGIAYLKVRDCIYTGKRPDVDLDRYPPFCNNLLMGAIEISRGCPHKCGYCQTPRLFGHRMRHRHPEMVAKYAGMMRDVRFVSPNAFAYGSNGICPEPDKVEALLEAIPEGRRIFFGTFPSEVRPEFVTEEMLRLVKQYCHNTSLSLGAQSGSQDVLDQIGRGHGVDEVKNAIQLCLEYKLTPIIDVIFGLPGETPDDQKDTLDLIKWIVDNNGRIHSHYFTPLPGTPLEDGAPSPVSRDVKRSMGRLALSGKVTGVWEPGI
ncbi:MAG: TIGR04013 family B12-binding domain/radical SAM domain-containing protein [Methanosarcinales archaeon]|nr:TIGR04013 family B12-binding domain/radical SAM domain-containing protein [Methanosarcinales archaeon]